MSEIPLVKNYEYMRFLNPFDTMFWVDLDLFYPEHKDEDKEEKPDFDEEEFIRVYGAEFLGYIEEGTTLRPLFLVLKKIAINLVSFNLVGKGEEEWKMLVSLYLAHQLQLAMARLKNQADEISLTPEKPKEKKITYTVERPTYELAEQLNKTNYGMVFWQMYEPYLRFKFKGIVTNRGFM